MHGLVIDIGNTWVKVGIFQQDTLLHHFQYASFDSAFFIQQIKPYTINKAIIASSGQGMSELKLFIQHLDIPVFTLEDSFPYSFTNQYQTKETLGQDRIALLEGAFGNYPLPFLVISCGTCITYNFVDETGAFIGGGISPGLHMRSKAMAAFTAYLPEVALTETTLPFIGTDTQACLKVGVLLGFQHEIAGFIAQYQHRYPKISIIITGGDALYLESPPKNKIFVDLFLTLKGLNQILQKHEI